MTITARWHLLIVAGVLLTGDAAAQRAVGCNPSGEGGSGWVEHLLDASDGCLVDGGGENGADGVDVADFDGDGDFDVVTGWEESGDIIVAINPGGSPDDLYWDIGQPWATVNVNGGHKKQGLEDAVFVDFQHDGRPEVVSAAEGDVREVFLSAVSPAGGNRFVAGSWKARDMPGDGRFFMRVQGADIDQDGDVDIVAGAKDSHGSNLSDIPAGIWWYENPSNTNSWTPDQGVGSWNRRKIAGDLFWIMEMVLEDMDGDGDLDVLFNDRRKMAWMRNPLAEGENVRNEEKWKKRVIESAGTLTGGKGTPYRWSHYANMDSDPEEELVVATNYDFGRGVVARWFDRDRVDTDPSDQNDTRWSAYEVVIEGNELPFNGGLPFNADEEGTQTSKAVVAHDLDGDGRVDLVLTARGGEDGVPGKGVGVYSLSYAPTLSGPPKCGNGTGQAPCTGVANGWTFHPIAPSYAADMKYDNLKVFDADGDADLDIVTVEENVDGKGLGLVAYENVEAPVARSDFAATTTGVPVVLDVAANDFDATLDRCSAGPTSAPSQGGTATVVGCGQIRYTPNPALGSYTDSFPYVICDTDPKTPCSFAEVQVFVWATFTPTTLTNGGFEATNQAGAIQHLPAGSTDLPGWTIAGGIDVVQSSYWEVDEGTNSIDLSGNSGEAGSIYQDIVTTPGDGYIVSFALASNPALSGGPRTLDVRIENAGVAIATRRFTFLVDGNSPLSMGWVQRQLGFGATGSSARIRFSTPDSSGAGPVIDDVVVTQAEGAGIVASDDVIGLEPRVINYLDVLANDTSTTPILADSVEVTNVVFGLGSCLVTENGLYGEPPTHLGDGRFELVPRIPCSYGSVFFEYQVCNQAGFCDTALVTVYNPVDTPEPPIAQDDHFEVSIADLNFFLFPALETNDLDANCVSGLFCTNEVPAIVEPPIYGSIVQTYPNLYAPDSGVELPPTPFDETFRYELCDFDGLCSQAQVTIHVIPEPLASWLGFSCLALLAWMRRGAQSSQIGASPGAGT